MARADLPAPSGVLRVMDTADFRELLSHWASTVAIIAARYGERIYATTITSFTPVAADPPTVVVSLGPNAQVLPFLFEGSRFAVSLLDETQGRVAEVCADPFPVGPSPFPDEGDPVVHEALAWVACSVHSIVEVPGSSRLIVGAVEEGAVGGGRPLLWHRRTSTRLADD